MANDDIYDFVDDDPTPAPPRVRPIAPSSTAPPLPCPKCKYNLRGSRLDRCPECGTTVTMSKLLSQSNKYQVSLWRDVYREPVLWIIGGLALGCSTLGSQFGLPGVIYFLVVCAFLVITGWIVFLFCSVIWIGFDQPLHTTAVQLAGAYIGYAGVSESLKLTGIRGIPMLISWFVLVILLRRLLDIDSNDAFIIAFFVGVVKWLLVMTVVAMILASL